MFERGDFRTESLCLFREIFATFIHPASAQSCKLPVSAFCQMTCGETPSRFIIDGDSVKTLHQACKRDNGAFRGEFPDLFIVVAAVAFHSRNPDIGIDAFCPQKFKGLHLSFKPSGGDRQKKMNIFRREHFVDSGKNVCPERAFQTVAHDASDQIGPLHSHGACIDIGLVIFPPDYFFDPRTGFLRNMICPGFSIQVHGCRSQRYICFFRNIT